MDQINSESLYSVSSKNSTPIGMYLQCSVPTKVLNQAVKRNDDRFPQDFRFQLTAAEFADLRSQIATSSLEGTGIKESPRNRSQTVTGSQKHRDPRFRPWVFTEHDAALRDIYHKLLPLLQPQPDPPKRRIGFISSEE